MLFICEQHSEATDLSLSNENVPGPSDRQPQPPQPQLRSTQSDQWREILTQRPAQIRQLEIQEELLRIQHAKLIVK